MFRSRVLLPWAVVAVIPFSLSAQAVVSVHSGVVNFFEGSVSVDGQPLEQKFGKFYDVKPGAELRTDEGRAEVLLTPGVFFRVDQNSSIRMISNRLTDTRVEFVGGSAALDSLNASSSFPISVTYKTYQIKIDKPGQYRFNSAPAELRVDRGEAQVAYANRTVVVHEGLCAAVCSGVDDARFSKPDGRWVGSMGEGSQRYDCGE